MLSFFLAAFVHLALFGGGIAGYAHPAVSTPPAHHHMHTFDATGAPPTG
jgi:hypothetical protein